MADNIIEVGVQVNSGAVQSGMSTAVSAVQAGTAQMRASFGGLDSSAQSLGASFAMIGKGGEDLGGSFERANSTVPQASQNFRMFGQTLEGVRTASGHVTEGSRAISGAFMELEGRIPIRAVERFLATSETIGPILTAAFPVVGAVALAAALVHLGGEAYHAYENIVELREGIQGLNNQEITVGKFVQSQADETERHIEDILTKTQGRAASLRQKLAYDSNKGTDLSELFYSKETKSLPDDVKANYETMYKQVAPADIPDRLRQITTEVTNLKAALASTDNAFAVQKSVGGYGPDGDRDPRAYYQARLQLAQQVQRELSAASDNRTSGLQATQTDEGDAEQKEQEKKQRAAEEGQRKAEEAQRKAAEATRQAQEAAFQGMEAYVVKWREDGDVAAKAVYDYWAGQANSSELGARQLDAVQRKMAELATEGARQAHEEITRFQQEQKRGGEEADRSLEEYHRGQARGAEEAAAAEERYARTIAEGTAIQARNAEALGEAQIRAGEAAGTITRLGAAQAEARIHTAAMTAELKALQAELDSLQAKTPTVGLTGIAADPKAQEEIQRLRNQIAQLQGREATQQTGDASAIATQQSAPLRAATQQVGTGLDNALAGWEKGQQTFAQSWERTLGQMVLSLQRNVLEMGVQWVQHYAQQRALAAANAAVQKTQAAATTIAAKAESASQASTQGQNAAITAAKNTYAATSGIPLIGPVLAPIAAAGAFAAVAALGMPSAQGGWDMVPADNTITNLHKNEMVLPSGLADRVRNMTGGGDTIHNHFGGNNFGGQNQSFADQLDKHEDHLANKIKGMQRDGKLS